VKTAFPGVELFQNQEVVFGLSARKNNSCNWSYEARCIGDTFLPLIYLMAISSEETCEHHLDPQQHLFLQHVKRVGDKDTKFKPGIVCSNDGKSHEIIPPDGKEFFVAINAIMTKKDAIKKFGLPAAKNTVSRSSQ
jgi:hypothetical protein